VLGRDSVTSGLAVGRVGTLAELHELRAEWDRLVERAPAATVFQSWAWVATWYEHFAPDRPLEVLTFRDAAGALVGVAPCSRSRRGGVRLLHLLGRGNDLTEYVGVLADGAHEASVARALVDAWAADAGRWDLVVLPAVLDDAPVVRDVRRLAAARGWRVVAEPQTRMTRPLPGDWPAFYRSLRKSMKDNVNNYANRLRREGRAERLVVADEPAALGPALERLLDLHRRRAAAVDLGRRHEDRFATAARRAFLRAVAGRLAARGELWVGLLEVDGEVLAAQACLVHRERLYLYYSGFDPAWARYGVMTVLTRRCIERAIAQGCRELDLLLGLDQEKQRWGAEPRPVASLALASGRLRSRAALALYGARRRPAAAAAPAGAAVSADPAGSPSARGEPRTWWSRWTGGLPAPPWSRPRTVPGGSPPEG
jgi:CelD/BcsL family acetyltransferase involved in cellulose biosynthesis